MSGHLISVVIPTYHRNDLLARCLERLVPGRQTLDASLYEVIVTDDGKISSAETMIREQFPWARWEKGLQRGPAANRNSGAEKATGEWIAFLDDDCIPSPGWLSAYYAAMADKIDVYEGKTTCEAGCKPFVEESPLNLTGGLLWSCNMMIRKNTFVEVDGFDESFPNPAMEDIDFQGRIIAAGHPPFFVADAVVDHPPRPTRLGFAAGKLWESRALFIFKHGDRRTIRWWLPMHVLRVRVGGFLRGGLSRYTAISLWSATLEFSYVFIHAGAWERKYSKLYPLRHA